MGVKGTPATTETRNFQHPTSLAGDRDTAVPAPALFSNHHERLVMQGHRLIQGVEHALGWTGPSALGTQFARGKLSDAELVSRLLTPRRLLDVLMWRSLSPPQVRCLTNGTELHPRDYITEITSRRGQTITMVDMHRLGHLLESGCTLVVDAINRWDATMDVACRSWQWWSRERVQVNIYLTTQDTSGFTLHWDDHDVIIEAYSRGPVEL